MPAEKNTENFNAKLIQKASYAFKIALHEMKAKKGSQVQAYEAALPSIFGCQQHKHGCSIA